jgi:TonB family protein
MKKLPVWLVAAAMLITPPIAIAAPVQPPKWVVNWGQKKCSLLRQTNGDTLTLQIVPGTREPELLLMRQSSEMVEPRWKERVDIRLSPSGATIEADGARAGLAGQSVAQMTGMGPDFIDRFANSNAIRLATSSRELAAVDLPNAAKAVGALRQCIDRVLDEWGVDPNVLSSLKRQPELISGPWLRPEDYPDSAEREEVARSTVVRFTVGVDGRVSDCTPVASSGSALLDRQTCSALIKRARFAPALGANGQVVPVTLVESAIWGIEA